MKTWIRLNVPSRTLDERLHARVEELLERPTELAFEKWAEETEHIVSLMDEAHWLADVVYGNPATDESSIPPLPKRSRDDGPQPPYHLLRVAARLRKQRFDLGGGEGLASYCSTFGGSTDSATLRDTSPSEGLL